MTEIMFETFNVPHFYLANKCVLSLFAAGRVTGVVVKSGYMFTRCCAIHNGSLVENTAVKKCIGGRNITMELMELVTANKSFCNLELAREIKEKFGFISVDFNNEKLSEIQYELPDGRVMTVGNERFKCFEKLFDDKNDGLAVLINKCINTCDIGFGDELFGNIVLSGGNTYIRGFEQRLQKDFENLCTFQREHLIDGYLRKYGKGTFYEDVMNITYDYFGLDKVNVIALPERKYLAYIGGKIVTSMDDFINKCISKEEYNEFGSMVVHRKCS